MCFVRGFIFAETDIAIDPKKRSFRIDVKFRGKGVEMRLKRGNKRLHGELDVCLVFTLVFLKPGPVVVSFQPAKEVNSIFRESDERRININIDRWNIQGVSPTVKWFD